MDFILLFLFLYLSIYLFIFTNYTMTTVFGILCISLGNAAHISTTSTPQTYNLWSNSIKPGLKSKVLNMCRLFNPSINGSEKTNYVKDDLNY